MQKLLLLGDEAIAQGFIDAGGSAINSYPGTPSTQITEYVMKSKEAKDKGISIVFTTSIAGSRHGHDGGIAAGGIDLPVGRIEIGAEHGPHIVTGITGDAVIEGAVGG